MPSVVPATVNASWNCPTHEPLAGYETAALLTFAAKGNVDAVDAEPYGHESRLSSEFCNTYATVVSAADAVADENESIANSAVLPHTDPDAVEGSGERAQVGELNPGSHAAWTSATNQWAMSCSALLW